MKPRKEFRTRGRGTGLGLGLALWLLQAALHAAVSGGGGGGGTITTNQLATGTNIFSTTSGGIMTLNVPTDFTNVFHVNKDSNLSSILTNAPNNSMILLGQGDWTNTCSYVFSNGNLGMFHLRDRTNIEIRGFGQATLRTVTEGDILNLSNCSNIRLVGIKFRGVKQTNVTQTANYGAVIPAACKNIEVYGCDFSEIGNHAIVDHGGLAGAFQSTNVYIENNTFFWVGSWTANLGYDGAGVQMSSYWKIRNNRFIECSQPIEFFGPNEAVACIHNIVEDNYIENPVKLGMGENGCTNSYFNRISRNFMFVNNALRTKASNALSSCDAINIGIGRGVRIEDNTIIGFPQCAINFASHTAFEAWGNTVERNTISNCTLGIWVQKESGSAAKRGFRVAGNKFYYTQSPIAMGGSDHVIVDNDMEDSSPPGLGSSIGGIMAGSSFTTWPATNIQILNNRVFGSPGFASGKAGIHIDSDCVGCRQYGNIISSTAHSPKVVDNGVNGQPYLGIEMVPGIATNPFAIYSTNGTLTWAVDSRGAAIIPNTLTGLEAAPTNFIRFGADNFGGMNLPNWTDHNGLTAALQPLIAHEHIYWLSTFTGAIPGGEGVAPVTNGGTTITHSTPIESQLHMVDLATAATSNACASIFSATYLANAGAHNGSSKIGGYFYAATWCSTNLIGQVVGGGAPRTFVGLTARAAEDYTNMVVTTNATGQYVGLMCDASQSTNMFLTARDASAEFRTNTGLPFIATNVYKFYLFNAPTSRFVGWRLDDAYSGASMSGWFSNNVPTNFMAFGLATKNGTNRAHSIRYARLYLQAPLAPPR